MNFQINRSPFDKKIIQNDTLIEIKLIIQIVAYYYTLSYMIDILVKIKI